MLLILKTFTSRQKQIRFFLTCLLFFTLTEITSGHIFASYKHSYNLKNYQIAKEQLQESLEKKKKLFSKELIKHQELFAKGLISSKELFKYESDLKNIDFLEKLLTKNLGFKEIKAIENQYSSNLESKEKKLEKFRRLFEQGLISRDYYHKLKQETEFSQRILSFVNTYKIFDHYAPEIKDLRLEYQNLFGSRHKISSHFGFRENPFGLGSKEFHTGIDFACPVGTKIKAILPGKIIKVIDSTNSGGGRKIYIKHSNNLVSIYMHLSKIKVKLGQNVKAGEIIAFSGKSGTRVTGPHLHFELKYKNISINPVYYFSNLL